MSEWIPVSERLPQPYTYVLVTVDDSLEHGENFVTEVYYVGPGQWRHGGEFVEVVAWMPLPEPYRLAE